MSALTPSQAPDLSPAIRTPVKVVTVMLIIVQAVTAWYLVGTLAFPALITAATAWVVFRDVRFRISNPARIRLCIGLAIVFLIKSRVAPLQVRGGVITPMTQIAHVIGQFLLVLQLLLLATSRNERILPQLLPWVGATAMICAGDIYVNDIERSVFQLLVVLFITLAAVFSALNREMFARKNASLRTPVLGLLLIAVGALGWWSASTLHAHSQDLESLISNLVDPQSIPQESGFTTQGKLRSVIRFRDVNAEDVALRVYSESKPGYLRGYVFGEFAQNEWFSNKKTERAKQPSVLGDVPRDEDENAFYLTTSHDVELDTPMQVWPIGNLEAVVFQPENSFCVTAAVETLVTTDEGNVAAPDLPVGYPYTVHRAKEPQSKQLPRESILQNGYADLSSVPPIARELASTLIKPSDSFDQKTMAVTSYFQDNFQYSTDFEATPGRNPIEWFLLEGKTGHCEYFATAAALVLRSAGIPTRYVTGLVAIEQNTYGDYWVARNKNAHAWVEAWDEERGRWMLVEATPAAGVPQDPNTGQLSQLWNYLSDRYQFFRVRLHQRGLLWGIKTLLSSWFLRALLGLGLILIFIRLRRWNRGRPAQRGPVWRDPHAKAFQRVLSRVDSRINRQHGLARGANETVSQFASRITSTVPGGDAISNWYQEYAIARYSPHADDAVAKLRTAAKAL